MKTHYQILIIGAGTAGIMVAAQLRKLRPNLTLGLLDPSEKHYYQPAWTLVGGGAYSFKKTERPMSNLIPKGVDWIREAAREISPSENAVITSSMRRITYDYLVVAPGLVNDLSLIDGLAEAVEQGVVCSNYIDPEYTWQCLQNFQGGTAVFTQPTTPIKCGGAPQKIMYLAAEYFAKKQLSAKTQIIYASPGAVVFGVKIIAETLMKVIKRHQIDFKPFRAPVKIDAAKKIAYFKDVQPTDNNCIVNQDNQAIHESSSEWLAIAFDLLHLAPPQVAPPFLKGCGLLNQAGWLDVDIHSMQHKHYPNVFGLGDVAALPTAKTGAAIRKQAPVVVENLVRLIEGQTALNTSYQGYSSCPLVTGYGKMALAEFNYKNEFTPDPKLKRMLVFTSYKEHWRLWLLKKHLLPYLYWNKMLKGKQV